MSWDRQVTSTNPITPGKGHALPCNWVMNALAVRELKLRLAIATLSLGGIQKVMKLAKIDIILKTKPKPSSLL